jgi:hypothetical protein
MSDVESDLLNFMKVSPIVLAVGHVAVSWGGLEHAINKAIWSAASMAPEDGACVTAQIIPILPRMRALIALVKRRNVSSKLLGDLNKFSSRVDRLSRGRNRVVHDPWLFRDSKSPSPDGVEFGRLEITADKSLVFEIKTQTVDEIYALTKAINDATEAFESLSARISSELGEPRGERHEPSSEGSQDSPNQDSGM